MAIRLGNRKFSIPPSRLYAFEMRRVIPSIYRLYALSSIYGIRLSELLRWYGVPA